MKKNKHSFEAGFDHTYLGVKPFIKLIKKFDLQWTQRKKEGYEGTNALPYVYGFKNGYLVLGNDPLTGNYQDLLARSPELGYCSYIGICGTKKFRDDMVRFIKRHTKDIKGFDPNRRIFI